MRTRNRLRNPALAIAKPLAVIPQRYPKQHMSTLQII